MHTHQIIGCFTNSRSALFFVAIACGWGHSLVSAPSVQAADTPAASQKRAAPAFSIRNPIDKLLSEQWAEQSVTPAPVCTDEEFARRVYLDVCGAIPRIEELKRFVNDPNPSKRTKLIDKLLGPPRGPMENTFGKPRSFERYGYDEQYARHWSMIWCDMLAADTSFGGVPITHHEFRQWIKESLAANKAYDVFVREMIMASGVLDRGVYAKNLELEFFAKEPTNSVASAFMGTRMSCAQCHDHPFDKWTQKDFQSLQSFFSRRSTIYDPINALLQMEASEELPAEAQRLLEPYFNEARAEAAKSNHPVDLISRYDNNEYVVTHVAPSPYIKNKMPVFKTNTPQTDLATAIKAPAMDNLAVGAGSMTAPAMGAASMTAPLMDAPAMGASSMTAPAAKPGNADAHNPPDKLAANDPSEAPRFADIIKEFRAGNSTLVRVQGIIDWVVKKLASEHSYSKEKCDWLHKELYYFTIDGPAFCCDKPEDPRGVVSYFPWDPTKVFDPKTLPTSTGDYKAVGPRRAALADFVTSSQQFAEVQANRLWAQLMGRGIVDPIDQFKEKNPPSNPALLQYLTDEFIASNYDNKHVLRLILNSGAYQLAVVEPSSGAGPDPALFAAPRHRRMTAEQVFDSLLIATGFTGGWDDQILNRDTLISQGEYDKFLPIRWAFDLPSPAPLSSALIQAYRQPLRHDPSFQRNEAASISQKLEMMNGLSNEMIKHSPAINRWVANEMSPEELTREAYITVLNRQPSPEELKFLIGSGSVKANRKWVEELVWSLLNSSEFVYRR